MSDRPTIEVRTIQSVSAAAVATSSVKRRRACCQANTRPIGTPAASGQSSSSLKYQAVRLGIVSGGRRRFTSPASVFVPCSECSG